MSEQDTTTATQGETPATTTATTETVTTTETPPWGDDFDPKRAWATIQNLRSIEDEHKKLLKEKADREKAEADAERKRLEENQQYQQLAETTRKELDDLKPEAEKAKRYEAALKAHLETEREGLPDYIIELLDTKDVAEQLEYIAKNRDKLKPQETASVRGIRDTRSDNGREQTRDELIAQEIAAQRSGRGRPY